jgi:hypothetical protein
VTARRILLAQVAVLLAAAATGLAAAAARPRD